MNSNTLGGIRKLKDGEGNYLWSDSLKAGEPATFMGYSVFDDDYMPDAGADAYPIAFGDFKTNEGRFVPLSPELVAMFKASGACPE
jgi:HK97 family phage major capsid protein